MTGDPDLQYPTWSDEDASRARQLAVIWRAAAERLFATAAGEPELYRRTVLLVSALVDRLRGEPPALASLLTAWTERDRVLSEVAEGQPDLAAPADPEATLAAAFALRYNEVVMEVAATRRLRLLSTYDEPGTWVVLEEQGLSSGDPFHAYRRVEAHVGTGRALLVTTVPAEDLAACTHEVTRGRVDLSTGGLHWDEVSTRYDDEAARESAVAAAKVADP